VSGRVGEWVGEWASGRVGEWVSGPAVASRGNDRMSTHICCLLIYRVAGLVMAPAFTRETTRALVEVGYREGNPQMQVSGLRIDT
jgi:hypothetical protein